jgi:hypothetical protein
MCCGYIPAFSHQYHQYQEPEPRSRNMIPLQGLNSIIIPLIDPPLSQILLPRLPDMRHIPRKLREHCGIKHQRCAIRNIRHDIQPHSGGPLSRLSDSKRPILQSPANDCKSEEQPAPERAVVCGTPEPDKDYCHEGEAEAICYQHNRGDGSCPSGPRDYARRRIGAGLPGRGPWLPAGAVKGPLKPRRSRMLVQEWDKALQCLGIRKRAYSVVS